MPQPLGISGLRKIQAEIKRLDPEGRFVDLDIDEGVVQYGAEIKAHSALSSYSGEEEPVRALIVAWLCTGGGYLPANIELEKSYSVGRPKAGARLDILVNHADGRPYALIEVKAPVEYEIDSDKYIKGQLFDVSQHEAGASVLAYVTAEVATAVAIRALAIPLKPGLTFAQWAKSRVAAADIPKNYGEPIHVHLARDGVRDLSLDTSASALDALRKRLHDVLWRGTTPDNLVYEYVVKLFLAKIFDEKTTRSGEQYRFQILYSGQTRETPQHTFSRISGLYIEAYSRYVASSPRDKAEPLDKSAFSAEQIAFVVELIQNVSLTSAQGGGDILGSFFEAITRDGFKQSKGLFFTHLNLAAFLLLAAGIEDLTVQRLHSNALFSERLPYVIDPSCGSGTFLLAAMKLITDYVTLHREDLAVNPDVEEFLDERFPAHHPNAWANDFLYGLDDSALLAMSTKVNMVLHRDGNTHIYHADGLLPLSKYVSPRLKGSPPENPAYYSRPVAESFDLVVSNPPFSITLPPNTSESLADSFELAGDRNSENLFLERWYQLLKPGGRLAVVLPESTFSTQENFRARNFLLDHFDVRAIVSLPKHAFEPWTPTRTCLLFAVKKGRQEEQEWMDAKAVAAAATRSKKEKAIRALRRMAKEHGSDAVLSPKVATSEQLQDLKSVLSELDQGQALEDASAQLRDLLLAVKAIDPDVDGLREAAERRGSEYLAITVDSIGYKRTKRTEYNRPNELFEAFADSEDEDGQPSMERVLNLNLGPRKWWVEISCDDPADILSILTARRIWD